MPFARLPLLILRGKRKAFMSNSTSDFEYLGRDPMTGRWVVKEQLYPEVRGWLEHEFTTEQQALGWMKRLRSSNVIDIRSARRAAPGIDAAWPRPGGVSHDRRGSVHESPAAESGGAQHLV